VCYSFRSRTDEAEWAGMSLEYYRQRAEGKWQWRREKDGLRSEPRNNLTLRSWRNQVVAMFRQLQDFPYRVINNQIGKLPES
jgi:hypothetical protein